MLHTMNGNPYMMILIGAFDYMLIRLGDGRFRVWHHVTPADGGYGREVDFLLPADYFRTHRVEEFYDHVASMQARMATEPSRAENLRALKRQLTDAGWLKK